MTENPRVLVKLPTRVEGQFELISPFDVSAIEHHYSSESCVVHLRNHSEESGYLILLSQQETADRLGITVVDRVEP